MEALVGVSVGRVQSLAVCKTKLRFRFLVKIFSSRMGTLGYHGVLDACRREVFRETSWIVDLSTLPRELTTKGPLF